VWTVTFGTARTWRGRSPPRPLLAVIEVSLGVNHGGVAVVAAAGIRVSAVNLGVQPTTFECVARASRLLRRAASSSSYCRSDEEKSHYPHLEVLVRRDVDVDKWTSTAGGGELVVNRTSLLILGCFLVSHLGSGLE